MRRELIYNYSSSSLASAGSIESNSNIRLENGRYTQANDIFREQTRFSKYKNSTKNCFTKICRLKTIQKKFPITRWLPKYNVDKLVSDLVAGFTVGLTLIPQGIAFAGIAGLPPQIGLYSGIVGCFIYILIGSTEIVTIGPTALMAIMTLTYIANKEKEYKVLYSTILSFITGIVTLFLGVFQLGFIVNFISTPVNSGFCSAAAITIISTQVKGLLGLKFKAESFLGVIQGVIEHYAEVRLWDSLLSITCILLLLFLMKLQIIFGFLMKKNIVLAKFIWFISTARNAIIIIGTTAFTAGITQEIGECPFKVVGDINPGLPEIQIPPFEVRNNDTNVTTNYGQILSQIDSAIIVLPFIAIMEHTTVAKAFGGDSRLDASQEMISIGVSNIANSFIMGMPITGAFSRSTVNALSGAKSPIGGIVTGLIVILSLLFLTPYFFYIPKKIRNYSQLRVYSSFSHLSKRAALAAVISTAVIFTIEYHIVKPLWQTKKLELIPWGLTLFISLFVGLEYGILVGIVISVFFLLFYNARPGIKIFRGFTRRGTEYIMLELDRSLTFPSVEYTRYMVTKSARVYGFDNIDIVLDCNHIQYSDFTAATAFKKLFDSFSKKGEQLIVLYRAKSSLISLLYGVIPDVPYCDTEEQLDLFLDGAKGITDLNSTLCVWSNNNCSSPPVGQRNMDKITMSPIAINY